MQKEKIKKESMRESYGLALTDYGEINKDVVVIDADVSNSTFTTYFAKKFPERFFNVGIAEEGMIDVAAGLALEGKIPFANSFAALICYRALEQIRTCVAYNNTNVKIISSYAGVSDYKDGPTHHAISDIAIMRSLPNMTVLVASDSTEARKMVVAAAEYSGPVYLRLSREDVPVIFGDTHEVTIGKGVKVREGDDLTLICTGVVTSCALEAAEKLSKSGIEARIVEIHTIKPLDREMILNCADETGAIVTIEEHNIIGGLFGAISEVIVRENNIPVEAVGINDFYARTARSAMDLYGYLELTAEKIIKVSNKVLKKKKTIK